MCGISAGYALSGIKVMNLLTKYLPMRIRKLIGTVILLVFIPFYALVAMAITASPGVINANKWLQMLCYIVAGTLWTIPAGLLIRWMSRDDATPKA
jgi:Protein of unknown function (DUF2842)